MTMKIISYNIRTGMVDEKNFSGELNNWKYRKDALFSLIKRYSPDIFWVQEDCLSQIEDLKTVFWLEYHISYFPEVLDDANQEFNALFVRKEYEILDSGYFWISQNYQKKSKLEWSLCYRNANWLKIKKEDQIYTIVNVHLDHSEDYSFKLVEADCFMNILNKVFGEQLQDNFILLGDFNLIPDCNQAYHTISRQVTDVSKLLGIREPTHPNWLIRNIYKQIDYFFVSENLKEKIQEMQIIKDKYTRLDWIDLEPSDHFPIMFQIN